MTFDFPQTTLHRTKALVSQVDLCRLLCDTQHQFGFIKHFMLNVYYVYMYMGYLFEFYIKPCGTDKTECKIIMIDL